jgi:hypothetical protein
MNAAMSRPFTEVEKTILNMLLEHDFEGATEFRLQLDYAVVVNWDGEDPSIVIEVNPAAPRSTYEGGGPLPYEGRVTTVKDGPVDEILVFAKDGYLSILEYVDTWGRKVRSWPEPVSISVFRPRNY